MPRGIQRAVLRAYATRYDLCVIGGGAAGYAGAVRGWDMGKKVVLIEQHERKFGGAAVWDGLSTKTVWQLARRSKNVKEFLQARGMYIEEPIQEIIKGAHDAANAKSLQMGQQLEALSESIDFRRREPTRAVASGAVEVLSGRAQFTSPHCVSIEGVDGAIQEIEADHFLIATGSVPAKCPDVPVDGHRIIDSSHLMSLKEWPSKLLVLGAGVLGCEMATIFQNFGKTQVHLVNQGKQRLLDNEDEDLTSFITSKFQLGGTRVHNDVTVMKTVVRPNGVLCTMGRRVSGRGATAQYKEDYALQVDYVLVATGRVPNVENLGLEKAGVELTAKGSIKTDDTEVRSSSAPHIYAAGDIAGDVGLASVAEMEARCAVEHMFDPSSVVPICYDTVCSILFLTPEVACVGMNETEARRLGIPYTVAVVGLDLISRSVIGFQRIPSRLTDEHLPLDTRLGFVKMIVSNDDEKVLLGMRCAGREASAIMGIAALLIRDRRSIRELLRVLHPSPSTTEAVQECARLLLGYSICKPHVFKNSIHVRSYTPDEPLFEVFESSSCPEVPVEQLKEFFEKRDILPEDIQQFLKDNGSDGSTCCVDRDRFYEFLRVTGPTLVPSYLD
jgi:dihydrolipoamide dehydrogenase